MTSTHLIYLELTSLESFVEELKRRSITEVRQCEWRRQNQLFEHRKLRLTALDPNSGLILRLDIPFYNDFTIKNKRERKKYEQAREKVQHQIDNKLKEADIKLLDGEYYYSKAEW